MFSHREEVKSRSETNEHFPVGSPACDHHQPHSPPLRAWAHERGMSCMDDQVKLAPHEVQGRLGIASAGNGGNYDTFFMGSVLYVYHSFVLCLLFIRLQINQRKVERICNQNTRSPLPMERSGLWSFHLYLLGTDHCQFQPIHMPVLGTHEKGPGRERMHVIFFFSSALLYLQISIYVAFHGRKESHITWFSWFCYF